MVESIFVKFNSFLVKENFYCNGCDNFLEKSKTKDFSNFDDYKICIYCYDVFCV